MSEGVLYRKYRPQKFADVSGQAEIVSVLESQIKSGRFAHAYLFAGSRGTGKTSVARILARALGCTEKDLYEIDAASNTGVDDVRELREGVRSLPFESPVKVYLIDEVHMLSKAAFNALLKTLEEPPTHAVFILATTKLYKVPDTVVSRCELYVFKRPTVEILTDTVKEIIKKEGLKIDSEAAKLTAFLGDGSFRDTLGILQKILAGTSNKHITLEVVERVTGASPVKMVHDFLRALLVAEAADGLSIIETAVKNNLAVKVFSRQVLDELRSVMLLKYNPSVAARLKAEASSEQLNFYQELSVSKNAQKLSGVLKILLEAHDLLGTTYLTQLPLELAVIDICEKLSKTEVSR